MAIYITGDVHGDIDIVKLRRKDFMAGEGDYVIVCGDFGAVWDGDVHDEKLQEWYNSRPWTTLFVDGNHENHDLLASYPVEIWNGGKVHRISDKIIHLMRGQVFEIAGKTFFTMGGASSHDKEYRVEGRDWWAGEMHSIKEQNEAIDNLNKVSSVDFVLTHCAPELIQQEFAYWYGQDTVTHFLEFVRTNYGFGHWYFGHYHIDKNFGPVFTCVYDNVIRVA